VAALVAVLAAWKTRNILVTILSGMAALWLMRAIL
jgi:branched-subunit amino acid transport protein